MTCPNRRPSGKSQRAERGRRYRPVVEILEGRRLLALFIENFSNDFDPSQPGFDTWDNDPSTLFPDEMAIPSQITSGVAISSTNLFPPAPSAPHFLAITRPAAYYLMDFGSTQGQPGGLDPDGEVVAVSFEYEGIGRVDFFGANGVKSVAANAGFGSWNSVTVTSNSLNNAGTELGAIQWVQIAAIEGLYVDDVAVLVLDGGFSNNPPIANDDLLTTLPGQPVEFDPLANDGDSDGDPVTLTGINFNPPNGTLTTSDEGFTYAPRPGFHGVETLSYTISDGRSGAATGTVRITVNTPPPAPVVTIPLPHLHTGSFTFSLTELWGHSPDADGDLLTLADFDTLNFGTLANNGNGTLTYFPAEPSGLVRSDVQFQFRLSDGFTIGQRGVALLRPNAPPVSFDSDLRGTLAHSDLFRPVVGGVGFDPDGDAIQPVLDREPTAGTVRFEGGGSEPWRFVYEARPGNYPQAGGYIEDSFTFHLVETTDYRSAGNVATVQLAFPNVLPTAVDDDAYISLNPAYLPPLGEYRFDAPGILRNDIDLDGDPVFGARIVRQPNSGTARFDSAVGAFTYQSFDYVDGRSDSFTYVATDQFGESNEATVVVNIDLIPRADDDQFEVGHNATGQPARYFLVAADRGPFVNDFDAAGIPARLDGIGSSVAVSGADGQQFVFDERSDEVTILTHRGQVVFRGDGSFLYLPNPGEIGGDSFLYEWNWMFPNEDSEVASVEIEIINRNPVAVAGGSYTIFEGQSIVLDASASYDPDGDSLTHHWELSNRSWEGANPTVTWSEINGLGPDETLRLSVRDEFNYGAADHATLRIRGDGISDGQENGGPNGGDGNRDGIPDRLQGNVTSFRLPYPATVASPPGTYLVGLDPDPNLPPRTIPGTPTYALGFTLAGLTPGQATIVSLIPENPIVANSYAKYGPRPNDPATPADERVPQWYEFLYDGTTGVRFYDVAGQEIAPHGNTPVARFDLYLVDGQRGDSDLTANGQVDDPGGPAFVELELPHVEQVLVNDGHAQRSKITSLTVTFDAPLNIEPNAFELRRIGARKPVDLRIALTEVDGHSVARLTFKNGRDVQFGSLANGAYILTIRGERLRDAAGRLLDGDDDGVAGGNYREEFVRLFGDTDGDGDVDGGDKTVFSKAYNKRSHQPGYLWYLDYNANGRIWAEDLALFLLGYCRRPRR
jgi:hypothetical protein